MKCKFTVPLPRGEAEVRFRLYQCPNCKDTTESLEVTKELVDEEWMKAALQRGRESRFRFISRLGKK
jgi:hypothetical protein